LGERFLSWQLVSEYIITFFRVFRLHFRIL
jgi:hypothetical protein